MVDLKTKKVVTLAGAGAGSVAIVLLLLYMSPTAIIDKNSGMEERVVGIYKNQTYGLFHDNGYFIEKCNYIEENQSWQSCYNDNNSYTEYKKELVLVNKEIRLVKKDVDEVVIQ